MNRTVNRAAERLRKRNEFADLIQIYDDDKGQVTLPARIAINARASFEHADNATAELGADKARRMAAARATQAPNRQTRRGSCTLHPTSPTRPARLLYGDETWRRTGRPNRPAATRRTITRSRLCRNSGGHDCPQRSKR